MPSTIAKMGWALIAAQSSAALAGQLEVAPTTLDLPPRVTSTILTVTNHGSERTGIQVRGFAWAQTPADDTLTPTKALLISPPMAQLDPGESQTVRILLREQPTAAEASYRLLVDELPAAGTAGVVRLALRVSLPMFVAPTRQTAPAMQWRLVSSNTGMELQASNHGTKRERVSDMAVQVAGLGTVKPQPLVNAWVLAGADRHWTIPSAHAGELHVSQVSLSAKLESGAINASVPVLRGP